MSRPHRILVVDDDDRSRFIIKNCLEDAGYEATCVADAFSALATAGQSAIDLIICDTLMPEMDGLSLMRRVRFTQPMLPFAFLDRNSDDKGVLAAMKEGADGYLKKPIDPGEFLVVIERLWKQVRFRMSQRVPEPGSALFSFENLTSSSPAMGKALAAARQVSASPRTTVTIFGESGVGKEVLARAIHVASKVSLKKFVAVNCAAIPESLLESELFGHIRGAFTGAVCDREGKCCRADGGTLFLDEIGDMPLSLQPKLLRLLEERAYEKVGSDRQVAADFRIIVATHRDLEACCREGTFRLDLYHRLNIFPITIPPLRERREDIPRLVDRILAGLRQQQGRLPLLSQASLNLLLAHHWPGNVRELRNVLEYASIVSNGEIIAPEHLRLQPAFACREQPAVDRITLHLDLPKEEFSLDAVISQVADWALRKCHHNKSSAARLLKTSRKLYY